MPSSDLKHRLDTAVAAARAAGQIAADYFEGLSLDVEIKKDGTPVTVADRQTEAELRHRIENAFPDDEILGEEFPAKPGRSGYRWVIDPIDGTKSFIHGVPLFGTMVGVERRDPSANANTPGECIIGVIYLPALKECVYAAQGQGAWHVKGDNTPRLARVSNIARLTDSLFVCGTVSGFASENRAGSFEQLRAACKLTRGWGDCYGYVLVATGRAELMVDPALSLWDMAALPTILTEAGGTFTNWQGEPTIYGRDGVATNGHVFNEVLAITRGK
jgi:histidinol-phosphatase